MTFLFLLLPSILAALLAGLVRPYRAWVGRVNALLALLPLGAALVFCAQAAASGSAPVAGPNDLLRADSLSALLMLCISAVAALALFLSPNLHRADEQTLPSPPAPLPQRERGENFALFRRLAAEKEHKNNLPALEGGDRGVGESGPVALKPFDGGFLPDIGQKSTDSSHELGPDQLRRYQVFVNLFVAAMLLAVSANNVGVMWVSIEATTIFSALVIPLVLSKASVEASWKYILIGSTGIALAFAGTVLAYFDFVNQAGVVENALNWPVLVASAPALHPEIIRLAFIFLLVGYGTKAGLAPMHTWLPDAHAEAPAPLSALMSGVLLAVAVYAVMRWKVVVDTLLGPAFTNQLLIWLGTLSILIAVFSLIIQRNYKRMLAYSSIEHTGLICLGLGLGPAGIFAALLLLICHTAAKSMLFLLAGSILQRYHSTRISHVTGLLKAMPWTGGLFAAGLLALIGLPPFGMFAAELALFRAGFGGGAAWLMVLVLVVLTVAFISLVRHLNAMLYGAVPEGISTGEQLGWRNALVFINLAVLTVLGVAIPAPLTALLNQIVEITQRIGVVVK